MTILTTTLAQLRKAEACVGGYNKLVRTLQGKPFTSEDEERETHLRFTHKDEIPLELILESNGLDDALWALRASNCSERDARLLAVAFARDVEHLMPEASRSALDVAERFANGQATAQELAEARSAAGAACDAAYAAYAAGAACDAAYAAYGAACDAAYAARQRQTELFLQLCQGAAPWQTQH